MRATAQTSTRLTPAFNNTLVSSETVPPVVTTSSRIATRSTPGGRRIRNAPRTLDRRSFRANPAWGGVAETRAQLRISTGIEHSRPTVRAISRAWL